MSVSKKHKEVNTGLTNLMTHMKNDYHNWSMTGRTVHQNTEDFIRESKIREIWKNDIVMVLVMM